MEEFIEKVKENNILVLLILGILFIIIIFVVILIMMWGDFFTGDDISQSTNTQVSSQNIKEYEYKKITNEDVISSYINLITPTLLMGSSSEIYDVVSQKYSADNDFSADTLYNYLEKKGILKTPFQVSSYKYLENSRYGAIWEIELQTVSNVFEKILIIEESPNQIKLSFDNYIGEMAVNKTVVNGGLKITLNNIKEYTTRAEIEITVENITSDGLILNNRNNRECTFLSFSTSSTDSVSNSNSWAAGEHIRLNPGEIRNAELIYELTDLSSGVIESLIVYNVYNEKTKEETDLEFKLF